MVREAGRPVRLELHPDVVVVALSGRDVFSLLNSLFAPGPARLLTGHESYQDGHRITLPLVLQIESDRVHYARRDEPADRDLPPNIEFVRAVETARETELDTRPPEPSPPWIYFDGKGDLGGLAADQIGTVRLERTGPDRFWLQIGRLQVQLSAPPSESGAAGSIHCEAWSLAVDHPYFTDTLLQGANATAMLAKQSDEPPYE